MATKATSVIRCFRGTVQKFVHQSRSTACEMTYTVFVPSAAKSRRVPAMYFLSGLTCTPENFVTKAGAFAAAEREGIAIVAPDTSPRGVNIPGEDDAYDFGSGAGFYVDATQSPWSTNYNMASYVVDELPAVVDAALPGVLTADRAVCGHSMGGHGALTSYLRNPGAFASASAFSPICNPTAVPWGEKAFSGYLGDDRAAWAEYDATLLVSKFDGPKVPFLVDQGTADTFLEEQLKPENLEAACREADYPITVNMREGYDHSYYFISTFMDDHVSFAAENLRKAASS